MLYGMAVGYTFVQAMFKAGRNPTRAGLVSAIQNGLPRGPRWHRTLILLAIIRASPAPMWVLSRMAS